jgi:hypothetical protein
MAVGGHVCGFIDKKVNNRVNYETHEGVNGRVRVSDMIINSVV